MRGHEALIAMRRKGIRPEAAFFSLDASPYSLADDWQHWAKSGAHIDIAPTDSIGTLDLRFVVGMTVLIDGTHEARCVALHEACREAGAARVVTHVSRVCDGGKRVETVLQMLDAEITFEAETA